MAEQPFRGDMSLKILKHHLFAFVCFIATHVSLTQKLAITFDILNVV